MPDLVIYGRADCVQCKATSRAAAKLGLTFDYVDLDQDMAAQARMINAGHRSLPVVEYGDEVWTGFRPDRLARIGGGQ